MGRADPLLLLDNGTLANILENGEYRFTNLKFEEAKAIIEMHSTDCAGQLRAGGFKN